MATLLDILKDKKSPRRFALVVQGGGMRGVYSAGVLACFDHFKLTTTLELYKSRS